MADNKLKPKPSSVRFVDAEMVERSRQMALFNPMHEDCYEGEVIERTYNLRTEPGRGYTRGDDSRDNELGRFYRQVREDKTVSFPVRDEQREVGGKQGGFNYYDPERLDPITKFPRMRFFKIGEKVIAPQSVMERMVKYRYVHPKTRKLKDKDQEKYRNI